MIYVLGGGDNLNFKVVNGTTQPGSPKENTLWVNTSEAIHAWDFSATAPLRRSRNKNLLCYPFADTTKTANGITWTDNGDGTITASGTAATDSSSTFRCSLRNGASCTLSLPAGSYWLSGAGNGITLQAGISYDKGATVARYINDNGNGNAVVLTADAYVSVFAYVSKGTSVSNAVARPQLEKGYAATSFIKGSAMGHVWFETGNSSLASFNALKKNSVMVYPLRAKMYQNDGKLASKNVKLYQNGAWRDLSQYLFNLGDEFTDVTGGWMTEAVRLQSGGQQAEAPVVTKQSNGGVKLHMDYGSGIYRAKNKIDLTDVNTLTFNGEINERTGNDNWMGMYVWSAIGSYYVDNVSASVTVKGTKRTGDITLDVSKLSGSFYVGFGLHENTTGSDAGYIILNSLLMS